MCRRTERKVVVNLVDNGRVNNIRLVAESVAKMMINERGLR